MKILLLFYINKIHSKKDVKMIISRLQDITKMTITTFVLGYLLLTENK